MPAFALFSVVLCGRTVRLSVCHCHRQLADDIHGLRETNHKCRGLLSLQNRLQRKSKFDTSSGGPVELLGD